MKFQKRKISATTTIYYVQEPDQTLVKLVDNHFMAEIAKPEEEATIRVIRKTDDRSREIYRLKFRQEVYYIKKYYQFTLKQKIKYLNLRLLRIKNLIVTPRIPLIGVDTFQPLFILKNRKNIFNHESIIVTKNL